MKSSLQISILFVLVLASGVAQAQFNIGYVFSSNIPVSVSGNTLNNAWSGGLNNPQFSEIDLDSDGHKDLFVFDRDGDIVKTFLNGGIPGNISYTHAPYYQNKFPKGLNGFALIRDYNCDGHPDIFSHGGGGFSVYRNITQTPYPTFQREVQLLLSDYGSVVTFAYVLSADIPGIEDIDGDGDLDIITFGIGQTLNTVEYHQNLSMDLYGTCDSLTFKVATRCWGDFEESGQTNVLDQISCKGVTPPEWGKGGRHPGSSLLPLDMDGDHDMDLLLGDISAPNLIHLTNTGDSLTAHMDLPQKDTLFPSNDTPVDMDLLPAAYYLDVNNDGIKDLIVATNNDVDSSLDQNNVWLYANNGDNNTPDFALTDNSFLGGDMIDVGSGAYPAFFDADGDGLHDLLIGNIFSKSISGYNPGRIAYYRNIGTSSNPAFEWVTDDYANISALEIYGIKPTFGDIDNDGREEMIIGDSDGNLHLFEDNNNSGASDFSLAQANYISDGADFYAAPQLYDLNGDQLLDLIIGERKGTLNYYENTGTASSPSFGPTPTISGIGDVDTEPVCCSGFSVPFLTDKLDSTGTTYLLVSAENGKVYIYDNILNNLNGTFDLLDSIITTGHRASIAGADLNGNDLLELVFGEKAGGISLMKREIVVRPGISELSPIKELKLFPNPANDLISLEINLLEPDVVEFNIYDILGRKQQIEIRTLSSGLSITDIVISDLPSGLYIGQLIDGKGNARVIKFVKQ